TLADYVPEKGPDGSNDEGGGGNGERTKVLVAKETIPAGTKIVDPDKYFAEADWPASAVGGNFIVKADDLRGKGVMKAIPQSVPPTKEAFMDDGGRSSVPSDRAVLQDQPPVKDGKTHVITFQVGGNAPFHATYRNGRLDDGGNQPAAPSVGRSSQEIRPEGKDEEKSEKPEK